MRHARILLAFVLTASLLSLLACKPAAGPAASKPAAPLQQPGLQSIDFFGLDLRLANRQKLETLFYQTFQTPLVPRNEFESVADASKIFPGAGTVEVATTENGMLATMQFVFPGKGDPQLTTAVVQQMETRYGKPTAVLGKIEQGEYRAIWDRGGDFIIQAGRGWPDTTVYLNFVSTKYLLQMREDRQKKLSSDQNLKRPGQ